MSPERRDPSDPAEWLRHARSNLAVAAAGRALPGVLWESLCFEAQQATEKAIKAVLVFGQVPFPKTHSLVQILDIAQRAGFHVSDQIREAEDLTGYAVEARYPSLEEVTEEEYKWAIAVAQRVVRWAELIIQGKSS